MQNVPLKNLLKKLSSLGFESLDLFGHRHKPTIVDEMGQLCHALLQLKGESTSVTISAEVLDTYHRCSAEEKRNFFRLLHEEFAPSPATLDEAIEEYREKRSQDAMQHLSQVAESPRQELFRILNIAPDATYRLVCMRADLIQLLPGHPEFEVIDQDMLKLFRSWFNRGFLQLRRIDWQTPALVLEKLIEYESVHEIRGWPDLRRRLESDRRCYAFFHPVIPDTPLIFVEVALTDEMSATISSLLDQQPQHDDPEGSSRSRFDTAVFYSINNCLQGLRGVSFGSFLIKQVVENLAASSPEIDTFITLSPVPGFMKWLQQTDHAALGLDEEERERLSELTASDAALTEARLNAAPEIQALLVRLCAHYLVNEKSRGKPKDPVARFHLGNGARLERINWMADSSRNGLSQSAGIMVNYLYDRDSMADNHEAYETDNTISCSGEVRKLANRKERKEKERKNREQKNREQQAKAQKKEAASEADTEQDHTEQDQEKA